MFLLLLLLLREKGGLTPTRSLDFVLILSHSLLASTDTDQKFSFSSLVLRSNNELTYIYIYTGRRRLLRVLVRDARLGHRRRGFGRVHVALHMVDAFGVTNDVRKMDDERD
jgi:hypothetical protein